MEAPSRLKSKLDDTTLANLIVQIAEKDELALAELYNLSFEKIFVVAFSILKDYADSEDIVQEVYLRIWLTAPRYHYCLRSPISWINSITRNLAIDRRRVASRVDLDADDCIALSLVDSSPTPHQALEAAQRSILILEMVDRLGALGAEAIRLAFFEDISYETVASRLKVPLGTAKSAIRRSLERMRADASKL